MSDINKKVMTLLERLKASKPQLEAIETETLGTVYTRRQTGEDQLKIVALQREIGRDTMLGLPKSTFAAVMGAVMLLNEDGTPLFPKADEGYAVLKDCGADELNELYDALMRHHSGSVALEEAEKKSSSSQSSESGTN